MKRFLYKNITKKNISLIINGEKIIVKPGKTIEGTDFLSNYSGLLKINQVSNQNQPSKVVENEETPIVIEEENLDCILEIEEYDFNTPPTKIDLYDVTLNIPVAIESKDRQINLTILMDYLYKHINTNVLICEISNEPRIKHFWKPEWSSFLKTILHKK